MYNPVFRFIKHYFSYLKIFEKFIGTLSFFGIIVWEKDRSKCKIPRALVLWEEAEKREIKMKQAVLFRKPIDIYKVESKQKKFIFSGLPRPKNYNNSSLDWMDDKHILKSRLIKAGLPVPIGGSVWNFKQAKEIFGEIQATSYPFNKLRAGKLPAASLPVIVKPRAGSRGRHSTTFVSNIDDLKKAYKIAKQLCFWVVVEEQIMGPVYRATLINYELCGVLRGDCPQVIGDGVHTIRELIEIKNKEPHGEVKDIIIDEVIERFLYRGLRAKLIGLSKTEKIFDYIPAEGEVIQLSEKIGVSYGGSSSEDFDICHEHNKQLFIKAAKIVSDPIVGFDFIIPDITKSWKNQKCGFIEANSLPFINLHHNPLLGKPRNVAKKVWDMIEM